MCTAVNQLRDAVGIGWCVVAADLGREGGHCGLFKPEAADISAGTAQTGHSIIPSALGEGTQGRQGKHVVEPLNYMEDMVHCRRCALAERVGRASSIAEQP